MAREADSDLAYTVAKWFVFWGIGIRLLIAGARQVCQPAFTARTIFDTSDPNAEKLVLELGFGNLAMGSVAASSLFAPSLMLAAGLAGGLFLALAGLQHLRNSKRTAHENSALVTDLIVAMATIGPCAILLSR